MNIERHEFVAYVRGLTNTIKKCFLIYDEKSLTKKISTIFIKYLIGLYKQDQANKELVNELSRLKKIQADNKRVESRIDDIVEIMGTNKPSSILDIGAGIGTIVEAVGKHYNIPENKVYGLDFILAPRKGLTVITYDKNMNIPLPDNSVDLILLFLVLHHVPKRDQLMSEAVRILAPGGKILIREHNDDRTPEFYKFIEFIHSIWYFATDEKPSPLELLNKLEINDLFRRHNMASLIYKDIPSKYNYQRLYYQLFIKKLQQ